MAIQPLHSAGLTTEAFEQLFFEYQPRLVRFAVRYLEEELQQQIDEALTHLSEKSREIFTMSRQKEMKPKEIAEELGITRQAVKWLSMKRTRKALTSASSPVSPYGPVMVLF